MLGIKLHTVFHGFQLIVAVQVRRHMQKTVGQESAALVKFTQGKGSNAYLPGNGIELVYGSYFRPTGGNDKLPAAGRTIHRGRGQKGIVLFRHEQAAILILIINVVVKSVFPGGLYQPSSVAPADHYIKYRAWTVAATVQNFSAPAVLLFCTAGFKFLIQPFVRLPIIIIQAAQLFYVLFVFQSIASLQLFISPDEQRGEFTFRLGAEGLAFFCFLLLPLESLFGFFPLHPLFVIGNDHFMI